MATIALSSQLSLVPSFREIQIGATRSRNVRLSKFSPMFVTCSSTTKTKTQDSKAAGNGELSTSSTAAELGRKWLKNLSNTQGVARTVISSAIIVTLLSGAYAPAASAKRREGVNRPDLLPEKFTRVIDVGGFLSAGQEERISKDLERLENDTGYKVRVLAQNYPETPGLAIREFWEVDDNTVVFVADPGLSGNLLNFNVGAMVDLSVPRNFWSRLSGKYGNMFYWKENGEDTAIEEAIFAIDACLREPIGPTQCADIK